MKIKNKLHIKIRILRYHVIIVLISLLQFSAVAMFSSEEKLWFPYTIALTFDDGPHPYYTRKLVDLLAQYDVRATFFVVGKQVDKHPELLKPVTEQGHEIGNHTYTHSNLVKMTHNEVIAELEKMSDAVIRAVNEKPRYFRAPGGNCNDDVVRYARALGYEIAWWDIAPHDHIPQEPEEIAEKILSNVVDGDIVLLHSGIDSTVACLPHVIEELRSRGFRFVTVSEAHALREPVN